eukprot:451119-Pleurochrysis_carterae.AAC.1
MDSACGLWNAWTALRLVQRRHAPASNMKMKSGGQPSDLRRRAPVRTRETGRATAASEGKVAMSTESDPTRPSDQRPSASLSVARRRHSTCARALASSRASHSNSRPTHSKHSCLSSTRGRLARMLSAISSAFAARKRRGVDDTLLEEREVVLCVEDGRQRAVAVET